MYNTPKIQLQPHRIPLQPKPLRPLNNVRLNTKRKTQNTKYVKHTTQNVKSNIYSSIQNATAASENTNLKLIQTHTLMI